METIEFVISLFGGIAYGLMSYFAISAWFRLRKLGTDMHDWQEVSAKVYAIVSALKLQSTFDQLNEMKDTLRQLVQADQFEEAAKLKEIVKEQERAALESLKEFQETFGGECVKVDVEQIKRSWNGE